MKALAFWSILSKLLQMIFVTYNGSSLIIILNIDFKNWKIEYGKQTNGRLTKVAAAQVAAEPVVAWVG